MVVSKPTIPINYLEFPAKDLPVTQRFFSQVFGWVFTDYGPDYTAFSEAGIDGGFFKSDLQATTEMGSCLAVLYSRNLDLVQDAIVQAGGRIHKPTFSFPGGQRFHFLDPNGNEFAVWSDQLSD